MSAPRNYGAVAERAGGAEQLAFFDLEKGERFKAEARAWVRDNQAAWRYIKEQALERTHARKPFGIGELCEQVRWHFKTQGYKDFKVNNNYRAALARMLINELPQCEPYIKTRESVVDL